MKEIGVKLKMVPPLDKQFRPASMVNRAFLEAVKKCGNAVPLKIAIERANRHISVFDTLVFPESDEYREANLFYTERLVKSLLWIRGGWKVTIGGPRYIGEYIKNAYRKGGIREFDAGFMSRVYEKEFTVAVVNCNEVPDENEGAKPAGRHLDGCRIGLDLGGSDRKVSAVINGEPVYSEEVIWHPKTQSDPDYHYSEIVKALKTAASRMPRVDAVGISSAGIYVDNRVMVASLFIKVPEEVFDKKVKDILKKAVGELGDIPVEVANDGDVTALAGSMELNDTGVLGIAMGTSEAGGYVDHAGNITGWLNELAFVPVDYNPSSMVDEWSGDFGCGVKYFSQDAVIKLAHAAGIQLDDSLTPAEKLKAVQELHKKGDPRADSIFESIGCYLGYALAFYADFFDIKHVLVLGRVTSGKGGSIITEKAKEVLRKEFPELADKILIHLPDESSRRVGQSIAAASLPEIRK